MKMEERDRLIREKSEKQGQQQGQRQMAKLFCRLDQDNRLEDWRKATHDTDYRDSLLKEYGL